MKNDASADQGHFFQLATRPHQSFIRVCPRPKFNCVRALIALPTPAVHYVTNEIRLAGGGARKLMRLQRQIFIRRRMHVN